MASNRTIGVVLGVLVSAVVVAGNMSRGDRHGMSVYPDLVSLAIAPTVVYVLGRRRRLRGETPESVTEFGVRVGTIAGAVFAIGIGLFTISWFHTVPWWFWMFGSATAFGSVLVLSRLAAYAAGQKKAIAVS
jgi:uncharacterized oligopeptide transporter (OPT) family protein